MPTSAQRIRGGEMGAIVVLEGTASCRYTVNGVTPTAGVGHLTPTPSATNPVILQFEEEELLKAFLIIQTAAATSITYWFYVKDSRR
jgi:hypothetical protein